MLGPPDLIMLTPLKSELFTIEVICVRTDLNWVFRADRLVASSEVSDPDRAMPFNCLSRWEMLVPAEVATWMVDWPRCSDWITESNDPDVPRSFWAMAQIAP